MKTPERSRLLQVLLDRRDVIAESWYDAIAHTSFTPLTSSEVHHRLGELTEQAIVLLSSEPFEHLKAREIGSALAGMHYLNSQALSSTQNVLAFRLLEGLPADQTTALQPRLTALLCEIATGFFERACDTVLLEQERAKAALLRERRRIEEALRESEASLALAQQIAHVGHFDYDWINYRLYWSDEIFRIFGVSRQEFGGTFADYFGRVHPDDTAHIEKAAVEAFGGEAVPL